MNAVIYSVNPKIQRNTNIPAKSIALPIEHGAWGFLFEPLVAGLIVAPSLAAPWVALMFIAAFLTRQPLKFLLGDWQAKKNLPRTTLAGRFTFIYSSITVVGFAGTLFFAPLESFLPLIALTPFIFYLIARDVARQTRQLLPELIGAVALSSSTAVLALAANWTTEASLALWAVFAARLTGSIFYVRTRLRKEKGKDFSTAQTTGIHFLMLAAISFLAYLKFISVLPILVMTILTLRAVHGLSPFARPARAKDIGIKEIIYGTLTVLSVIFGFYLF